MLLLMEDSATLSYRYLPVSTPLPPHQPDTNADPSRSADEMVTIESLSGGGDQGQSRKTSDERRDLELSVAAAAAAAANSADIRLRVREPTPGPDENSEAEAVDIDEGDVDEAAVTHVPRPRERSQSTCAVNPFLASLQAEDLAVSGPQSKRRSVSTCGALSVSPPTKTLKSAAGEDDALNNPEDFPSRASSTLEFHRAKPPIFRPRESRHGPRHVHPRHSAHIRLNDMKYPHVEQPPSILVSSAGASSSSSSSGSSGGASRRVSSVGPGSRCHHIISEEPVISATPGGGDRSAPHVVQRTQSNPEMECCPVCLARKECEILLKRTYSKVYNQN